MSEEEKVMLTYDEAIWLYESMYDRYENGIVSIDIDSFLKAHEYHERTCHAVRHEVDITGRHAAIWLCSECDDYISLAHNYCPNCGAKVVEE